YSMERRQTRLSVQTCQERSVETPEQDNQCSQSKTDAEAIVELENSLTMAALDHQLSCRCKSCLLEIIVTDLRAEHLFRNAPTGHGDPDDWRWSNAVLEPFTTIETALLDTNDEEFIRLAFPVLASLIEKEIEARYEEDRFDPLPEQRPRGLNCARATRH